VSMMDEYFSNPGQSDPDQNARQVVAALGLKAITQKDFDSERPKCRCYTCSLALAESNAPYVRQGDTSQRFKRGRPMRGGHDAAFTAARLHHAREVERHLAGGADVDGVDADGNSLLSLACQHGHLEIVELCLRHRASPEVRNARSWTPLLLATLHGHRDTTMIVSALLSRRADPAGETAGGVTALHLACYRGDAPTVSALLPHCRAGVLEAATMGSWARPPNHPACGDRCSRRIITRWGTLLCTLGVSTACISWRMPRFPPSQLVAPRPSPSHLPRFRRILTYGATGGPPLYTLLQVEEECGC
jgi:hypothetical protein